MSSIKRTRFRDWFHSLPVLLDVLLTVGFCVGFFALFALIFDTPLDGDWISSSTTVTVFLVAYGLWLRHTYRRQHGTSRS